MPDKKNSFALIEHWFDKLVKLDKNSQNKKIADLQDNGTLNKAQSEQLLNILKADSQTEIETDIQSFSAEIGTELNSHTLSEEQKQIGPYLIEKPIGEGGMGLVYLAHRNDGEFEQQVAIKLPHFNLDKSILERFENERQILAQLTHPNIAHLLDGGTTNNQPYLVMEYIQGLSIDQYCIQNIPTLKQRIELIIQICAAVSFAHQKLVLHRDLKPNNILVTENGQVKLLDFGIAKLFNEDDEALANKTATQIMTRNYASPEQIQGKIVSTHSDLFSLAIIAYEIITGFHPYKNSNQHEREKDLVSGKIIRITSLTNEEPIFPELSKISIQKIQGDLENILLKALSSEPDKRYYNVQSFADDLLNFIENRTVTARKPSFYYSFIKLVQRQKIAATALLLTTVALFLATIYSFNKAQIADTERIKSQQIAQFMQSLFENARPSKDKVDMTLDELLSQGIHDLQKTEDIDSEIKYFLMNVIFKSYLQLNKNADLKILMKDVYQKCTNELSNINSNCINTLGYMAFYEYTMDNNTQALVYYQQIENIIRNIHPINKKELAIVLRQQFSPLINIRNATLANQKNKEAILLYKEIPDIDPMLSVNAYSDIIVSQIVAKDFSTIEQDLKELYQIKLQMGLQNDVQMASLYNLWGAYYRYSNQPLMALEKQIKAIDIMEKYYNFKKSISGTYLKVMASILYRANQTEKSLHYYKKTLKFYKTFGNGNEKRELITLIHIALMEFALNKTEAAQKTMNEIQQYDSQNLLSKANDRCNLKFAKAQMSFVDVNLNEHTAMKEFESCQATDNDNQEILDCYKHMLKAKSLLKQGKTQEALLAIKASEALFVKFPSDYLGLKSLVNEIRLSIQVEIKTHQSL